MQRHRVPRLKQAFTFQGMTPVEMLLVVGLFFAGYRIGGAISTHPFVPFLTGFLAYFLLYSRVKAVIIRYPPGYFGNYLKWLGTKDIYYPLPDDKVYPILVRVEGEASTKGEEVTAPAESPKGVPVPS